MRRGSKHYLYCLRAKECMLAAVAVFNNPLIRFKSETTITLVCTAWTYLLQVHCLENGLEIRKLDSCGARRKFARTAEGDVKTIELKELVKLSHDILSEACQENLVFLIGIRNRIQHYVGVELDSLIAPKIQANILTFKRVIEQVTDGAVSMGEELPFALQFSELSLHQTKELLTGKAIPVSLKTFILDFESKLAPEIWKDSEYQARVKLQVVNKERGEDLEFVKVLEIGTEAPEGVTASYLKEVEKRKYTPTEIIKQMHELGFPDFGMQEHIELWQKKDGKNPKYGYGCEIANRWFWYQSWIDQVVKPHCESVYTKPRNKPEEGKLNFSTITKVPSWLV